MKYYQTGEQTQQLRLDYDVRTDEQPVYIGFADQGVGESEDKWTLQKLTYDGSNRATQRGIAIGAWSKRTTLTYL